MVVDPGAVPVVVVAVVIILLGVVMNVYLKMASDVTYLAGGGSYCP